MECCYLNCDADARFEIFENNSRPDVGTLACEEHVGALLGSLLPGEEVTKSWTVVSLCP